MADRSIEILGSGAEPYVPPPEDQILLFSGLATAQALGSEIIAGPVLLAGLSTSESIGTLNILTPILFTGLATSEAIGSARVDVHIALTGLATSEALGTLDVSQSILLTGIPSTEAIGTATLSLLVGPFVGLESAEAIGTARLDMQVSLTGMSTGESVGTLRIDQEVALNGVPTSEAIGTATLSLLVGPLTGLASAEAVGAAQVNLSVALSGVPTSEVVGNEIIAGPVLIDGLPSAETIGDPLVSMSVHLTGISTSEVIGSLDVSRTLFPLGLPSAQHVGIPRIIVDRSVFLPATGAGPIVGFHRVAVDGGRIAGADTNRRGPVTGGQSITLLAPGLDMASVEDTFASALNLALWTPVTTGSGRVTVIPGFPRGTLQLSTGLCAGATAFVRSNVLTDRSDTQVDLALTPRFKTGVAVASASLGLYVGSTTYFRASVEVSRELSLLRVRGVENGTEHTNVLIPLVSIAALRLRVLRNKETIYVILNDAVVFQTTWTSTEAAIELGVTGDALGHASMTAAVTKYVRNPVILFGGEPMKDVTLKTQGRLDGLTPPHVKGVVSIHVETAASEFDLDETYEYQPVIDYRRVGVAGSSELVVTTDVTVKN